MANQNININVNARGIQQTTRQMNGLSRSMKSAGMSAGAASAALAAVGFVAASGARKVIQSADAFTNLSNQTKVFAKSSKSAAFKMQDTIDTARKMNSSLTEVGQVYQRISMVQAGAGFSDDTAAKMVENLTKAVKLSGATAQEAEGALRQFAQGLAANRLSGQELNSVLEQTPMIAQVLAQGMGVGVGALRKLGEEGKITTDVLVNIFGGSIDNLEKKFAKFSFTLEAQMVSVNRELSLFAGMMMHASGTATGLGGTINKYVTQPLVELNTMLKKGGKEAGAVFDTIEAAMVGAAAGVTILTVAAVGLTIATFPVTAAFFAIVGAVSLLTAVIYKYRNSTIDLFGSQVSMMDVMVGTWNLLKSSAISFFESVVAYGNAAWADMQRAFEITVKNITGAYTTMGNVIRGVFDTVVKYANLGVERLMMPLSALINKLIKVSNFIKKVMDADMSDMLADGFMSGAWEGAEDGAVDFAASFRSGVGIGIETLKEGVVQMGGMFDSAFGGAIDSASTRVEELILRTQEMAAGAAETLSKQHTEPDATSLPGLGLDDGGEEDDAEQTEAASRTLEEIQAAGFMNPTELFDSMKAGLADAKAHVFEFATSTRATIGEGLSGAFDLVTDSITEMATTGKANFKKFAVAMLQMIQKIIVQLLIQLAIQTAIKAMGGAVASPMTGPSAMAGGGTAGGMGGASGFGDLLGGGGGMSFAAGGGRVSGGDPVLVGERGPELFVPPTSGSVKNNTTTQGMMQQQAPEVTVVNVDSTQNTLDALGSEEGENLIMNVIQRNPEILRSLG